MSFRHDMNKFDSEANSIAVDSLLNYETVKYSTMKNLKLKDSVIFSLNGKILPCKV